MTGPAVLIVGDVVADLLVTLPPKTGRSTLKDILPPIYPGGTVGNTAVALARFGTPVSLASAVGADGYGSFLIEELTKLGVDTRRMITLPERYTLTISVIVDRDGERYFAMYPQEGMAQAYYPPERVKPEWFSEISWLHVSGSSFWEGTTAEAILRAMQFARDARIPVSFDMNLRPLDDRLPETVAARFWQAVQLSDVVLGSATDEFTFLTGLEDAVEAAHRLVAAGPTVVARAGALGCVVYRPDAGPIRSPAFPVHVVDTLGAGDVFDAGFIIAMLAGHDLVEAARWGNAAAALSISQAGAAIDLTRAGLAQLLA